MLAGELAQAFALGAEHQREWAGERSSLERLSTFLGEAYSEKAALAKLRQALRQILDENDRHEIERAAGGLVQGAVQRRAVAFGHDQAGGIEGGGGAQQGANIL